MIDETDYTGLHAHPMDPTVVEFVAYERVDGTWDVFVFEVLNVQIMDAPRNSARKTPLTTQNHNAIYIFALYQRCSLC